MHNKIFFLNHTNKHPSYTQYSTRVSKLKYIAHSCTFITKSGSFSSGVRPYFNSILVLVLSLESVVQKSNNTGSANIKLTELIF